MLGRSSGLAAMARGRRACGVKSFNLRPNRRMICGALRGDLRPRGGAEMPQQVHVVALAGAPAASIPTTRGHASALRDRAGMIISDN
jgi:hypothetical protein